MAILSNRLNNTIIIKENKSLIRTIINIYFSKYYNDDDIYQIGLIGLFYAARTFDADNIASFPTYASIIIKREIINYLKYEQKYVRNHPISDLSYCNYNSDKMNDNETNLENVLSYNNIFEEIEYKENIKIIKNSLSEFEFELFIMHLNGYTYREMEKYFKSYKTSLNDLMTCICQKLQKVPQLSNLYTD